MEGLYENFGGQGSAKVSDIFRDNADDYEEEIDSDFWVTNDTGGITCSTPITVGAINIPNTDGASGQVLTTNGQGVILGRRRRWSKFSC